MPNLILAPIICFTLSHSSAGMKIQRNECRRPCRCCCYGGLAYYRGRLTKFFSHVLVKITTNGYNLS